MKWSDILGPVGELLDGPDDKTIVTSTWILPMTNAPIPHQIPAPGDLEAMDKLPQESCENCRFFKSFSIGKGSCRRNPPENVNNYWIPYTWPTVALNEWCGEWEAKADD